MGAGKSYSACTLPGDSGQAPGRLLPIFWTNASDAFAGEEGQIVARCDDGEDGSFLSRNDADDALTPIQRYDTLILVRIHQLQIVVFLGYFCSSRPCKGIFKLPDNIPCRHSENAYQTLSVCLSQPILSFLIESCYNCYASFFDK